MKKHLHSSNISPCIHHIFIIISSSSMSMSNHLSNRRCMPNNHGIPLSKQRYLSSVSLSRTLRCINLFPIQPSFRSKSNQRYWQEKSIFDSNNRTSHVSYTVLQTSQELRMLSPSLFIQRSQCNC